MVSIPDFKRRFGYVMAKTSVLETLNESKWGLRKCWSGPQALTLGAEKQMPSVPFPASRELGHVPSPEFAEACSCQLLSRRITASAWQPLCWV